MSEANVPNVKVKPGDTLPRSSLGDLAGAPIPALSVLSD